MTTYHVQSKRPIRSIVATLLQKHGYRIATCVRPVEFYISTNENILDILEVLEEETGTEFESVEETNRWVDTGKIDLFTGDMVLSPVNTEIDTVLEEEVLLEMVE